MKYNSFGSTNIKVSALSFGGAGLGGCFADTPQEDDGINIVREAISNGINYIDTAPWYGNGRSEAVLGKALQNIPRQSYHIATKVCRYKPNIEEMFDFSAQRTLQSIDESLDRLKLDYIDVIQVHDMEFTPSLDKVLSETLPALQKAKDAGKVNHIGITSYELPLLKEVLQKSTVKIDTVLTYCQYTLFTQAAKEYFPVFKEYGVGIVNASPTGMGLLTENGPSSWHVAKPDLKKACAETATFCKANGYDVSDLATRFCFAEPDVHTTLVSMPTLAVLHNNIKAVDQKLSDKDLQMIDQLKERYFKPLKSCSWEKVELEKYHRKLKSLQQEN